MILSLNSKSTPERIPKTQPEGQFSLQMFIIVIKMHIIGKLNTSTERQVPRRPSLCPPLSSPPTGKPQTLSYDQGHLSPGLQSLLLSAFHFLSTPLQEGEGFYLKRWKREKRWEPGRCRLSSLSFSHHSPKQSCTSNRWLCFSPPPLPVPFSHLPSSQSPWTDLWLFRTSPLC